MTVIHCLRSAPWALLICLCFACSDERPDEVKSPPRADWFEDVAAESGLDFRHHNGFTGYRYLPETMGGGVAWLDFDGDGWLDAYFVDSAYAEGDDRSQPAINRLYRNLGNGKFEDVTQSAGVGDAGFGQGCAVGDIDNDGDPDLYVLNDGPNVLYRNDGDGTFTDITEAAGVAGNAWSVSAGFFDYDRDGDLDIYLVDYLVFSHELQRARFQGFEGRAAAYPHPDRFDGSPDILYRNDGQGHFEDVSDTSGIGSVIPGKGLGLALSDFDGDGDIDVYVANDSTRNFLFENTGDGQFEEIAALAGAAYNVDAQTEASMGVACGDANGDGRTDVFVTHLDLETNTFYENRSGEGLLEFVDQTRRTGLAEPSLNRVGFGTCFFDFDHDGDLDTLVVNGHVIDNIADRFATREYAQRDQLFESSGSRFTDVSDSAGAYFQLKLVGRGLALGDYDNDGDLDALIGNNGGPAVLLRNSAPKSGSWVSFRLIGGDGEPRDGQGTRLTIEAGGKKQVREARSCESYASASDTRVHFGVGSVDQVDRLEVRWPSGATETFRDLAVNRHYELKKGEQPRALK
ncbi:MAG: CRTAC1 family protein [Planctomycetota bacterium]